MKGLKTISISILALSLLAGSAVGAAAQDDPMAAAPVTGSITPWSEVSAGTTSSVDGATLVDAARFTTTWEASDPRLSGTTSITTDWKSYEGLRTLVEAANYSLENDADLVVVAWLTFISQPRGGSYVSDWIGSPSVTANARAELLASRPSQTYSRPQSCAPSYGADACGGPGSGGRSPCHVRPDQSRPTSVSFIRSICAA